MSYRREAVFLCLKSPFAISFHPILAAEHRHNRNFPVCLTFLWPDTACWSYRLPLRAEMPFTFKSWNVKSKLRLRCFSDAALLGFIQCALKLSRVYLDPDGW